MTNKGFSMVLSCQAKPNSADGLARNSPARPRDPGNSYGYIRICNAKRTLRHWGSNLGAYCANPLKIGCRNTQHINFDIVGIADNSALDNSRTTRHASESATNKTTCTALSSRKMLAFFNSAINNGFWRAWEIIGALFRTRITKPKNGSALHKIVNHRNDGEH